MSSFAISELFDRAMSHVNSGRGGEGVGLLQQVLAADPQHAEALYWLGTLASMSGRYEQAIDLLQRAIAVKPGVSHTYCTLGISLGAIGKLQDAISAYQRAIELDPNNAEAQINLGAALVATKQFEPAVAALRLGLAARPELAQAHLILSQALRQLKRFDEAIAAAEKLPPHSAAALNTMGLALLGKGRTDLAAEHFRRAAAIEPASFESQTNLALACKIVGRFEESVSAYQAAIKLRPGVAAIYNDLGEVFRMMDRPAEAEVAWKKALAIDPKLAEAYSNVGVAASTRGEFDRGIECYRRALECRENYAEAWLNLGNSYKDTGRINRAIGCFDRAIALEPENSAFDGLRLFALHYHPDWDAAALLRAHREWNQRHAAPLAGTIKPHRNSRSIDRRIRVGYISPDFREHVVGFSILPLLVHHNRAQFEIFCYSNVLTPDAITAAIRRQADHWSNITGIGDSLVAEEIRADEIDILVDLSVHSDLNRLLVFAQQPAPIQVSYLGYCSTTGMDAMDYRLSDLYIDPPDRDVSGYSEQTIRLGGTYWCYQQHDVVPEVGPLPAIDAGSITFGCLNHFAKISLAAQEIWARLLQAVPTARLLVHVSEGECREEFQRRFEQFGISRTRLELVPRQSWTEYISNYNRIDIALDPFPYGGGITTLDGMYMGVPVISLRGRTAVGRGGCSILSHTGLSELIAQTPEQYVQIATDLAADFPRLQKIRAGLRDRMRQSPLMDAPRYARDIEAAFKEMWQQWLTAGTL
jgi:protein O-GlcNAc transferase